MAHSRARIQRKSEGIGLKAILLVHGSLRMGGVETLLVRLAREFSSRGITVRILLLTRSADPGLIREVNRCATVCYLDQFVPLPVFGSERLTLLAAFLKLDAARLADMLAGIDHVHFTESLTMMLCAAVLARLSAPVRITGGVYYQHEYDYASPNQRYCCLAMAQHFSFHAASGRVMFHGEAAKRGLAERLGLDLTDCPLVPIGIDVRRARPRDLQRVRRTKVVSVGRLTEVKTYNFQFLVAVAELRRRGVPLEYHVYGDGPARDRLRHRIDELGLSSAVHLHGTLEYSSFGETIADAGLFVGSGTALIEAAACGVPALIGIEAQADDHSYGYLHEMSGLAYHEKGIPHPTAPFAVHVERLLALDDDAYWQTCAASVTKSEQYSIERLVDGWLSLDERITVQRSAASPPHFDRLRFVTSLVADRIAMSFRPNRSDFWARRFELTGAPVK